MNTLQQEVNRIILTLPHRESIEPANNLFNGLLLIGHNERSAKQLLRSYGLSRRLLFMLDPRKRSQCLSEIPEQMPLIHSCNAEW